MTREEAIARIKGHMFIHKMNEPRAIHISEALDMAIKALEQQPKTGHWKLVQRGKSIDICCSNCEAVRIKEYAYNYTIDQLSKEDLEECFECAEMRYCPHCGAYMREVEE